jgi:hypothetical protein
MKKLTLLLCLTLLISSAFAGDVKFKMNGNIRNRFALWGNYDNANNAVEKDGETRYLADSRLRWKFMSNLDERISVVWQVEVGDVTWGGNGGSIGTDGTNVETKHAYLEYMCPMTGMKFRAGLQAWADHRGLVFDDDLAALGIMHNMNGFDLGLYLGRANDGEDYGYNANELFILTAKKDMFGADVILNRGMDGDKLNSWVLPYATFKVSDVDIDAMVGLNLINQFEIEILDGVDDQSILPLQVNVTDGTSTWESWLSLPINAPVIEFTNAVVENQDGSISINPGESGKLKLEVYNSGHNLLENAIYNLTASSDDVSITNIPSFSTINPEDTQNLEFTFDVSADADLGSQYELNLSVSTDDYSWTITKSFTVGVIIEDFETGDFSFVDWENSNANPWTIVNEGYSGNFSAKSASMNHNQSSTISTQVNVFHDSQISFYFKVSSESGYDYLSFKIDGAMQQQWSGEVDWQQANIDITQGLHTIEWTYSKDQGAVDGQDCAWIDFIIFPPTNFNLVPPPNFNSALTDSIVTLTWDAPEISEASNNRNSRSRETELTGYLLIKDDEILAEIADPTVTQYVDTLHTLGTYDYKMRAVYGEIYSIFSPLEQVIYWYPIVPNNVNAIWSPGQTAVYVLWNLELVDDVNIPELVKFEIYHNDSYIDEVNTTDSWIYHHDSFVSGENRYNIKAIYSDNSESELSETAVLLGVSNEDVPDAPKVTILKQNSPNPFNPLTNIRFDIAEKESDVKVEIFNLKGQLVKTVVNEKLQQGRYNIQWNSKDNSSRNVSSGVYFIRMNSGSYKSTKKMLLLK